MEKLTKKKAKEWCIKKWEYIVANNGSEEGLLDKYPELNEFEAECAYCELYLRKDNMCDKCPLNYVSTTVKRPVKYKEVRIDCYDHKHPYKKWLNHQTKRNAQKVLDLIKNN